MNIDYLIQLLTNRLNGLALAKDQAFQSGDLERIIAVDAEILDVQNTLTKLKLLSTIEQTAAATPFSEAQVVKNGIQASFDLANLTDATACLGLYDITSYATDPFHEQKIANILEKMPLMDSPDVIETYIKKATPDSPLSGAMIFSAAQQYGIDTRLMLALMELDSRFGTVGVAVSTLNPGNVGNNDAGETRTYGSWGEGVMAVAGWLNNHRITQETPPVPEPIIPPVENTVTPVPEIPTVTDVTTTPPPAEIPVVTPPAEEPVVTPPSTTETQIEIPPTPPVEETPVVIPDTPVDSGTSTPSQEDQVVGVLKRKSKRKIA